MQCPPLAAKFFQMVTLTTENHNTKIYMFSLLKIFHLSIMYLEKTSI